MRPHTHTPYSRAAACLLVRASSEFSGVWLATRAVRDALAPLDGVKTARGLSRSADGFFTADTTEKRTGFTSSGDFCAAVDRDAW